MRLVILTHPPSLKSTSMPRVARQLGEGLRQRGHDVDYWTSPTFFGKLPVRSDGGRKWLGYLDQLLVFPLMLKGRVRRAHPETVFVFPDQALGPWVRAVARRPHLVHCNDFLAIRSSRGEFPENPTGWSGQQYQKIILSGLRHGKAFISISEATRGDLHRFVPGAEDFSEVVYLELNYPFRPLPEEEARELLKERLGAAEAGGYMLHVGGNQWYKNRRGVIELYRAWAAGQSNPMPLWIIGAPPTEATKALARDIPNGGSVRFLSGVSNEEVLAAYNLARVFLFPSLEEGFGWPIAEAMACGCPVLTTGKQPMSEVGGEAAFYLRRRKSGADPEWAAEGAALIGQILTESGPARDARREAGFRQAASFSAVSPVSRYEDAYRRVLERAGVNQP